MLAEHFEKLIEDYIEVKATKLFNDKINAVMAEITNALDAKIKTMNDLRVQTVEHEVESQLDDVLSGMVSEEVAKQLDDQLSDTVREEVAKQMEDIDWTDIDVTEQLKEMLQTATIRVEV
jgi:phosphoglycerate-specific signal transduction histidine kinase